MLKKKKKKKKDMPPCAEAVSNYCGGGMGTAGVEKDCDLQRSYAPEKPEIGNHVWKQSVRITYHWPISSSHRATFWILETSKC